MKKKTPDASKLATIDTNTGYEYRTVRERTLHKHPRSYEMTQTGMPTSYDSRLEDGAITLQFAYG